MLRMILSSYRTFDHTNQKDEKKVSGKIIQYVFYHIPPTVLADFNIYLLGEKNDISKKKNEDLRYILRFILHTWLSFFGISSFFFIFLVSLPSSPFF
jgi:hypothetical protein